MSRLNKLEPNSEAEGAYTSYIEDLWGYIVKYATYIVNKLNPTGFDEKKRVDLSGNEHFNKETKEFIKTPHVHEKESKGGIRKAKDEEIPKRSKNKKNGKS